MSKNIHTPFFANIAAADYAETAVLAAAVGKNILARLPFMHLQPQLILDVGCGTGQHTQLLQQQYPDARVIASDLHPDFLHYAQDAISTPCVLADTQQLPLRSHSVDMIFANLVLPWCMDLQKTLKEWQRVLRPEGLLMFTSLGPDTLRELLQPEYLTPNFLDMHLLGDALMQAGFSNPVMDVEYFSLNYRDQNKMVRELFVTGMLNDIQNFSPAVNYATFEVVYGHAWGGELGKMDEAGVVRIPINAIQKII